MRIGGGGPPRIIQQPAQTQQPQQLDDQQQNDQQAEGVGGAGKENKKPTQKGIETPGFGVTGDQTDDINPITSNKSRIEGGKEALDGIEGKEALQQLPSELNDVKDVDDAAEVRGFEAMEKAFDAAAADMDRGMRAQKAMGHGDDVEEIEDPSDVADALGNDNAVGDPADSWDNWDTGTDAKGVDPANPTAQLQEELQTEMMKGHVKGVTEISYNGKDDEEDGPKPL